MSIGRVPAEELTRQISAIRKRATEKLHRVRHYLVVCQHLARRDTRERGVGADGERRITVRRLDHLDRDGTRRIAPVGTERRGGFLVRSVAVVLRDRQIRDWLPFLAVVRDRGDAGELGHQPPNPFLGFGGSRHLLILAGRRVGARGRGAHAVCLLDALEERGASGLELAGVVRVETPTLQTSSLARRRSVGEARHFVADRARIATRQRADRRQSTDVAPRHRGLAGASSGGQEDAERDGDEGYEPPSHRDCEGTHGRTSFLVVVVDYERRLGLCAIQAAYTTRPMMMMTSLMTSSLSNPAKTIIQPLKL